MTRGEGREERESREESEGERREGKGNGE